jgi:hypothetical protein
LVPQPKLPHPAEALGEELADIVDPVVVQPVDHALDHRAGRLGLREIGVAAQHRLFGPRAPTPWLVRRVLPRLWRTVSHSFILLPAASRLGPIFLSLPGDGDHRGLAQQFQRVDRRGDFSLAFGTISASSARKPSVTLTAHRL